MTAPQDYYFDDQELTGMRIYNHRPDKPNFIFRDASVIIIDSIADKAITLNNQNFPGENITWKYIFRNCVFNQGVNIKFDSMFSAEFISCTFKNEGMFSNSKGIAQDPTFSSNCVFEGSATISLNGKRDYTLSDLTLGGELTISGSYNELILENIDQGGRATGELILSNVTVKKFTARSLNLHALRFSENASFISEVLVETTNADQFSSNQARIGLTLSLKHCKIAQFIVDNLTHGDHNEILIETSEITSKAQFKLGQLKSTNVSDCIINECIISETNNEGKIFNLQGSIITILNLEKVENKSNLSFRNIKLKHSGQLTINLSDLGKANFILCDFSAARLNFQSSKITDVFLSETDFPNEVKTMEGTDWLQSRLIASQLHTAFQKQGDTVRALEYQSREIEAHYESITFRGKHFWDKLNLFFNRCSSNFGRSWTRGIRFTLIWGFCFFYFVVVSSEEYSWGLSLPADVD